MPPSHSLHRKLHIDRLGQRAEGIASEAGRLVFVPHALPGEEVIAEVDGERGRLAEVLVESPERVAPFCPYYGTCGGCAIQVLAPAPYAVWKRGLLESALAHAKLVLPLDPLLDAHGEGRRRATFHARTEPSPLGPLHTEVGFMQARAHRIVAIDHCPILAPGMANAVAAARVVAEVLAPSLKPLDLLVTATREGLDVDVRGTGPLSFDLEQELIGAAERLDLARVSNHGTVVIERRPPWVAMGRARVILPPGAFLQATEAGETALARLVCEATGPTARVADLFAGVGTFTHRLAERSEVHAVESDASALAALQRAAHGTPELRTVTAEQRDLFRRPLSTAELDRFDAVVCDPPRAGAQAQMEALSASRVPLVVSVSCNVQSFARDAAILLGGGYRAERVVPVDQFRYSPHLEMVGVFRRERAKNARRRRLLG